MLILLFLRLSLTFIFFNNVVLSCLDADDCNQNGVCSLPAGTCICDASWTGTSCQLLTLQPSSRGDGTCEPAPGFAVARGALTTWGGAPLLEASGSWALTVSEMANHCGMIEWGGCSQGALWRATNASVVGPYERVGTVIGPYAHNVWPFRVNASLYLLFHIGIGCDSVGVHACNYTRMPTCTNGSTWPAKPPQGTHPVENPSGLSRASLFTASEPAGPWSPAPRNWTLPICSNNPTAVILRNGSMMLMCHEPFAGLNCKPAVNYLYTATSLTRDWAFGAWAARCVHTNNPNVTVNNITFSAFNEDPHLFLDPRGGLHALTHNQGPCYSGANASFYGADVRGCGGHMFSTDGGETWNFTWHAAYNGTVSFTDGTAVRYRRERPKLVVDDNGSPIALATALSLNIFPEAFQPGEDAACTLVSKLGSGTGTQSE